VTQNSENRIPFGLRDGVLVEVSEVESGLACSCVCPSCGGPLQARKGKVRSHYFAHDPSGVEHECVSAFETSIHLMAKEILKEEGSLLLPELVLNRTAEDQFGMTHTEELLVEEASKSVFERVELEKRLHDIRPDIIAYTESGPLLVEVAVTSFSDKRKRRKIWELGLPAVEIDLSPVSYSTTKAELRNLIDAESTKKVWLSNPKAIKAKKDLQAKLDAAIQQANSTVRSSPFENTTRRRKTADESRQIHTAESSGETRWFVCEACRDVFELSIRDAPRSVRTVKCPNCDFDVSADPPRGKH